MITFQSERKMKDRMKISYEQENKCKEAEISNLHNKMSQQGLNRRLSEVRLEYDKQLESKFLQFLALNMQTCF